MQWLEVVQAQSPMWPKRWVQARMRMLLARMRMLRARAGQPEEKGREPEVRLEKVG